MKPGCSTRPRSSSSRATIAASIVLPTPTSSRDQQAHPRLPQCHDERHELIWPRYDRDIAERAEWSRARAQAQTRRVKQSHDPGGVAATYRLGISEARWSHPIAFDRQEKADLLALRRR
jgi:hypothetical protein